MCNFFDFNGDGKVDAFEFLMATAADPNNPLNQPPEDDEEEESNTYADESDDNDEDDDCFTEDDDYDL